MKFADAIIRWIVRPSKFSDSKMEDLISLQTKKINHLNFSSQKEISLPLATEDIFQKRNTLRNFSKKRLHKKHFLNFIVKTLGKRNKNLKKPKYSLKKRVFPSAGGLNLIEALIYIKDVKEIDEGLYFLNIYKNKLQKIGSLNLKMALPYSQNIDLAKSKFIIFLFSNLKSGLLKYGPRAYKYALLESGHAAQNVLLGLRKYSMGGVCVGAFNEKLLKNKFKKYWPEYAIVCGMK